MTTKYTEDHEWAKHDGDVTVVGITDFAQSELGEIVFIELPEIGQTVGVGEEAAVVESVKAAGEVKAPISGEVIAINESLVDSPEIVNADPMGDGWFFKIKPADDGDFEQLMAEDSYTAYVASLSD